MHSRQNMKEVTTITERVTTITMEVTTMIEVVTISLTLLIFLLISKVINYIPYDHNKFLGLTIISTYRLLAI